MDRQKKQRERKNKREKRKKFNTKSLRHRETKAQRGKGTRRLHAGQAPGQRRSVGGVE